jgi:hypothetical protein
MKMSGMKAIRKAAEENVVISRDLSDSSSLDRVNEPGDDDPAVSRAETEPAGDEQKRNWCNDTVDIDAVPPLKVIEYINKPFAELHYLYNYLRVSNEDSCHEYAQKQCGGKLTDVNWLRFNLDLGGKDDDRFRMAHRQWNDPGQIELTDWAYFFEKVGLSRAYHGTRVDFFAANVKLRHAAVHRSHWELSKASLELAMMLPAILGDDRRASETKHVYEAFLQDPSSLDPSKASFLRTRLHPEREEPILIPELLCQIQTLLEASAFPYAKVEDPDFLKKYHFEVPEQVELQEYCKHWDESSSHVKQHPDSLFMYPDPEGRGFCFHSTLVNVIALRNNAAHRLFNVDPEISTAYAIRKQVESAKAFAIMVGDPATAEKIEIIASTWLAKYRPAANAM